MSFRAVRVCVERTIGMNGFLFIVALLLGVAVWWLWSERAIYQKDNLSLNEENDRLRTALRTLQSDYSQKDRALADVTGNFKKYRDGMSGAITVFANNLNELVDKYLPPVESPTEILLRMTPEQIAKGDIPMSHEFVRMLTQVTATKGEAVSFLYEAGLRLAIGFKRMLAVGQLNPHAIRFMGEYVNEVRETIAAQAPLLNSPGSKALYAFQLANAEIEMQEAILNGKPPPSAERIAFWLSEIEHVQAHAPEAPAATVDEVVVEKTSEAEPATVSPNGHRRKRRKEGASAHG